MRRRGTKKTTPFARVPLTLSGAKITNETNCVLGIFGLKFKRLRNIKKKN